MVCSQPFIKEEPLDPKPVTFTGDLGVIDNELEIVNFVPCHEVSHASCQVKEELLEGTSHPSRAKPSLLDSLPVEVTQPWSDTPDPTAGHVGVTLSDQPVTPHPLVGSDQSPMAGAIPPPTVTPADTTLAASAPSQGTTATIALLVVSRSTTLMP